MDTGNIEYWIEYALEALGKDQARQARAAQHQTDTWLRKPGVKPPLLLSCRDLPWQEEIPSPNHKEIHFDLEKMFLQGLKPALQCVAGGREAVASVRANMGCGIVPSLFGLTPLLFEDNMPWIQEHLSKETLMAMKPGDLAPNAEYEMAMKHMAYMAGRLEGTGCRLYPLDIQGAFDTAHLVYGDAIFYDLYDDPDFIHHLMDLSCAAIERAIDDCLRLIPGSEESVCHYNALLIPRSLGGIKFSEDTSTLLNREQIAEFVTPYLHRVLAYAGGGYVHYCGHNPHLYESVLSEPLAHGLNFGNPEKHDMIQVLGDLSTGGKHYYGGLSPDSSIPLADYYHSILEAATRDGHTYLLFVQGCGAEDKARITDAWDEAVSRLP